MTTVKDIGLDFDTTFNYITKHRNFNFDLEEIQALAVDLSRTKFVRDWLADVGLSSNLDSQMSAFTLLNARSRNDAPGILLDLAKSDDPIALEAFEIYKSAARLSNTDPVSTIFKGGQAINLGGNLEGILSVVSEAYPNFSSTEVNAYVRLHLLEALKTAQLNGGSVLAALEREIALDIDPKCFLSGTLISMFDGSTKPIENIAANDTVLSYDKNGDLTPGRVVRTFQNTVKQILDVHGLMVTPGHVTLCGDGTFKGQHVAMLDILRSDGALVLEDGSMVRAATGCAVGSEGDRMITAIIGETQPDGKIKVTETGKIRLGTRFILETGQDVSMIDLITANGGVVTNEGLIQTGVEGVEMPFRWTFTSSLPKPENYVLQRSATQLEDICQANEWEAVLPKMSGPISHKTDGGPSRGAPINVPLSMRA